MNSGLEVRFLGTGDAFGSGGRRHTSALLQSPSGSMLVDCGPSTLAALRGLGLEPGSVDAILITHFHGDHVGGVPFLLMDAHYATRRDRSLTLTGPPGLRHHLRSLHDVMFPGTGPLPFRFELTYVELQPGQPQQIGDAKVTAFEVRHSPSMRCDGLRIEYGGRVVAFSGDTEWSDALPELSRDADMFLCECYGYDTAPPGHLSYQTLMARRAEFTCRRMILTHMGPEMLQRTSQLKFETVTDGLVLQL